MSVPSAALTAAANRLQGQVPEFIGKFGKVDAAFLPNSS